MGDVQEEDPFEGPIKLVETCHIKSSLSKFHFSLIVKEQSKFTLQCQFEGRLVNLFDAYNTESSLSKLLFSIILKEYFKYKHKFTQRSLSSLEGVFQGGRPINNSKL